jgi:hypothetical protein
MHQQLWEYKVEWKSVSRGMGGKRLNTTALHCGVIKPYHSSLYTELCLKSLKECVLPNPNSTNNRDWVLSAACVYVGVTGQ